MRDNFRFTAAVAIRAGGDEAIGRARVSIVAYTGGVISPSGWADVVVDLDGAELAGPIPLLADHCEGLDALVGEGEAAIRNHELHVDGFLVDASAAGAKILALAKAGISLQASIGYQPDRIERVEPGASKKVNGRTIKAGPRGLAIARSGRLREVSLLPLGSDPNSRVAISAARRSQKKGSAMDDTLSPENVEKVNREMQAALPENQPDLSEPEKILARWSRQTWHYQDGPRQRAEAAMKAALAGKMSYADFQTALLEEALRDSELARIRGERPKPPAIGPSSRDFSDDITLAAGLMIRAGYGSAAEKAFNERVMDAADHLARRHALDLVEFALRHEGLEKPDGRDALIRAGLSTNTLPVALGTAGEKIMLDAYAAAPAVWQQWAKRISVSSFREHNVLRPSFLTAMKELGAAGEIEHGRVGEEKVALSANTFARLLSIDRRDLINDDLGVFGTAAAALGRSGARSLADLVITVLLVNADSFFSEGNHNLIDSPLSLAAVAVAIQQLRSQVDADGASLDLQPKVLLVPPQLESTARAICESEFIQAAEGAPSGNSLRGVLTPVVEPRLSNPAIPGSSDAVWFIFASPADCPQAVAFLNGVENPTVESLGLSAKVDTLEYSWRAYFDYGSALVDWRSAVMSSGEGG